MEYLELVFEDIQLIDVDTILKWMSFEKKNIIRSHFFIDGEDKKFEDINNFADYFKNKGTCNLTVKELNIGFPVKEAVIIISFDEKYGDITLTFSEEDWDINQAEEEKVSLLSNQLNLLKEKINFNTILFGYEPAEDIQLLCID